MMLDWLDTHAPSWLPRGRDAKYASLSSGAMRSTFARKRTWRWMSSHENTADASVAALCEGGGDVIEEGQHAYHDADIRPARRLESRDPALHPRQIGGFDLAQQLLGVVAIPCDLPMGDVSPAFVSQEQVLEPREPDLRV